MNVDFPGTVVKVVPLEVVKVAPPKSQAAGFKYPVPTREYLLKRTRKNL